MSKEVRDIRVVFSIFSCLFLLFSYKLFPGSLSYIFLTAAAVLIFLLAMFPLCLRPIFDQWIKVAKVVGRFNTRILLGIMFFLVFIPLGLLMRLLGKELLNKGFDDSETYWEPCRFVGLRDKTRYERQF